jgi:hypothetical protein
LDQANQGRQSEDRDRLTRNEARRITAGRLTWKDTKMSRAEKPGQRGQGQKKRLREGGGRKTNQERHDGDMERKIREDTARTTADK